MAWIQENISWMISVLCGDNNSPYKIGKEYSLNESLNLYREYLIRTNLVKDIGELSGKNLGCFCDQAGPCHAKILVEYYCHALNMKL